jgi:hypothetical protein
MGRAHYPGLWRVLDREANRLDHVGWADVTERGYGTLELTRESVTARWWFVHPYAAAPGADTVAAAAFRTARDLWPPSFEPVADDGDGDGDVSEPARPGTPEPLPPRPEDLGRLRVRRRMRLAAEAATMAVTATAVALGLALIARSVNQRWGGMVPAGRRRA